MALYKVILLCQVQRKALQVKDLQLKMAAPPMPNPLQF